MIIVFSFDDGRKDAYDAFEILQKHGLVASFHVTTGFVDKTFITDDFGVGRNALLIEDIKEMSDSNMDISSHGDKHIMGTEDFAQSYNKIQAWTKQSSKIGFSVPNSKFSKDELTAFVKDNGSKLKYIRVGRNKHCYTLINKARYCLYHLFHADYLFNKFNNSNIQNIESLNKYAINALVVKKDTRLRSLLTFIKKNQHKKDSFVVLMFHSIVDYPTNAWEWKKDDFIELCKFVEDTIKAGLNRCLTLSELVDKG